MVLVCRDAGCLAVRVLDDVVFESLPLRFWGYDVVDGEMHNLRFLDPAGVVVGLKPRGLAKHDTTGFVVRSQFAREAQ